VQAPDITAPTVNPPVNIATLNVLLRIAMALLVIVGLRVAWYEGRSWAHRKPGQSWWRVLSPGRLFRSDLHTPAGNELRRRAVRTLVLWLFLGLLILLGIGYRNALEAL